MRRAAALARVLGGVGILALLLWRLGSAAFLDGLRVIGPGTLLLAFGIGLAGTVLSAWRWCLVARGMGMRLPLRSAVADYYRALFLNAALPGGVIGDVHRAVQHGREEGDVGRGLRAVVLERTAGQAVLVGFGVAVLLSYPSPLVRGAHPGLLAAVVAAAALAVGLLLWKRPAAKPDARSRLGRAVATAWADLRNGYSRRTLPWVLLASAAVAAGHLTTFVVAARTAGSAAPLTRLLPLMLLALLSMMLPVNIGGWGPREGVTAWAFGAAGLSAAQGLTTSVVYGVLAFVASLPGAVVLLRAIVAGRAGDPPAATAPGPAPVPALQRSSA
jgi:uncharacterized membrane protein YbhN (UPF0104 family)